MDHQGLGILGGLAHPQDQGSHEDHQGQASQGPLGDQWGQSSQEGLLSQLLPWLLSPPACLQGLQGPVDPSFLEAQMDQVHQ